MENNGKKEYFRRDLEERTKKFALRIIRLVSALPGNPIGRVIGYQLLKCGTSIGANYREASRAESRADFKHKIAIVEKESGETMYWLELLAESEVFPKEKLSDLTDECNQLISIFVTIGKKVKRNAEGGSRKAEDGSRK